MKVEENHEGEGR